MNLDAQDPINGILIMWPPFNKENITRGYISNITIESEKLDCSNMNGINWIPSYRYIINFITDTKSLFYIKPTNTILIGCDPNINIIFPSKGIWEINVSGKPETMMCFGWNVKRIPYTTVVPIKSNCSTNYSEMKDIPEFNYKKIEKTKYEYTIAFYSGIDINKDKSYDASTVNCFRWVSQFGSVPREVFNHNASSTGN